MTPFTRNGAKLLSWLRLYVWLFFQHSNWLIVAFLSRHHCLGARCMIMNKTQISQRKWKLNNGGKNLELFQSLLERNIQQISKERKFFPRKHHASEYKQTPGNFLQNEGRLYWRVQCDLQLTTQQLNMVIHAIKPRGRIINARPESLQRIAPPIRSQ